jgi:type IV pilus assembly protein PilW
MKARAAAVTRPAPGLSLIELLVAMAIGLVVTIAITRIMISFEGSKRTSTALNDTIQSGAYGSNELDRAIRQAGTGYTQRVTETFGCRLNVFRSGAQVLPPTSAFPSPFNNASLVRRLAPVLIEPNAANSGAEVRGDIITVQSGAGGKSEMPLPAGTFTVIPTVSFALPLTIEYRQHDLVLLVGDRGGVRDCSIVQVAPNGVSAGVLLMGGEYYNAGGSTINFADYAGISTVYAAQMGNVIGNNPPKFRMFGVGDNATLFSYDLLQAGANALANAPQAMADSVVEMRALYGIDANFDHTVDRWQNPATSPFTYAELTDGSPAALLNLKRITAIRLGLILRSPLVEKVDQTTNLPVTQTNPVLFAGVLDGGGASLQRVRTLSPADQNYRYRTVEMTIPLRNMHFAPLP